MKKNSKGYPTQFGGIAAKTIREGSWTLSFPSTANANSFKTQWYNYRNALGIECDLEAWAAAMRVQVVVAGETVTFTDRDTSPLAKALDSALAGEPLDQAAIDFAELMKGGKL